MFAGSREDDLLNKLKNCVGSLPAHGSSLGNYCSTATKIQSFEVENSATKREASELGRFKQAGYNKAENSTKMSKIAAQLPSYRLSLQAIDRNEGLNRQTNLRAAKNYQQILRQDTRLYNNQAKQQVSQAYNLMNKNDENLIIFKGAAEVKQTLAERYSGKIANRSATKNILQHSSSINCNPAVLARLHKDHDIDAIARKYQAGTVKNEDYRLGQANNPSGYNCRGRSSIKPPIAAQQLERPATQRSGRFEPGLRLQLQQKEVGGREECSAMVKLRKISELNEKINQRIRNIIAVFEDQKV